MPFADYFINITSIFYFFLLQPLSLFQPPSSSVFPQPLSFPSSLPFISHSAIPSFPHLSVSIFHLSFPPWLLIALSISLAGDQYQLCGCFSSLSSPPLLFHFEAHLLVFRWIFFGGKCGSISSLSFCGCWPPSSWFYCLLCFSCYWMGKRLLVLYFLSPLFSLFLYFCSLSLAA